MIEKCKHLKLFKKHEKILLQGEFLPKNPPRVEENKKSNRKTPFPELKKKKSIDAEVVCGVKSCLPNLHFFLYYV